MSELSKWSTPSSSARWISRMPASSSLGPYTPDNDMQPRPIPETSGPALPSLRRSLTTVPLIDLSNR
jgi:hypothetical protein